MNLKKNFKQEGNQPNPIFKSFKILGLIGTSFLINFPALAQINLATLMDIIGNNNEVFIEEQVAQVPEQASLGQNIRTEQARAQIDFNTGATGRMAENSKIIVGQCVEVQEGVLIASGPANGCLLEFATGVQGTIYMLNVDRNNNTNSNTGTIRVLEGEIQLSSRNNPNDPNPITIQEGQKVSNLTQGLALSQVSVQRISKQEYEDIITGPLFQGYKTPLPNEDKLNEVCKRLYGNCRPVGGNGPVRGLW
ncbi:hypothetical protein [Planktothrix mougeotii]|uniref:FecR protein domain-containing protein n=1 Tax=Planktothrix mougeotii LEGE 06226 TaxID=1828728 RepID=A0ABR9UHA6_9CYAN|nr:hypothetical protein [Planktothrix mougeotii]MBE9145838.1 hypothetical protein [Planktothrix mougeotii LEGE 06226]